MLRASSASFWNVKLNLLLAIAKVTTFNMMKNHETVKSEGRPLSVCLAGEFTDLIFREVKNFFCHFDKPRVVVHFSTRL